jgi:hypothetical protein
MDFIERSGRSRVRGSDGRSAGAALLCFALLSAHCNAGRHRAPSPAGEPDGGGGPSPADGSRGGGPPASGTADAADTRGGGDSGRASSAAATAGAGRTQPPPSGVEDIIGEGPQACLLDPRESCPGTYDTGSTKAAKCAFYCGCIARECGGLASCMSLCMSQKKWDLCCRIKKCVTHQCDYSDQLGGDCDFARTGSNGCLNVDGTVGN